MWSESRSGLVPIVFYVASDASVSIRWVAHPEGIRGEATMCATPLAQLAQLSTRVLVV